MSDAPARISMGNPLTGEVKEYLAADLIDMDVLRSVEAASRPFVAAVFNDNGDVTVSTGHLTTGRWLKLCAALTALRAMMEKLK